MAKLVTINPQKSTTMGGVETLIRSIQDIGSKHDIHELFEYQPKQEHFESNGHVTYECYATSFRIPLLKKISTKLNQLKTLDSLDLSNGDIIVLFHPNDLLYVPKKQLKSCKIILVQTNKFEVFFQRLSKLIMMFRKKYIDVFTVYTEADRQRLLHLYPDFSNRAKVIPRGCKLKTAKKPAQFSKKLITIARIHEEQKNFSEMINVLDRLPEGYTLDIYGDGNFDEVTDLKEKLIAKSNVTYKGPTNDVAATLAGYSLFLMTSRYEGFGQTLIEARSQGLPLVVYNTFDALSWIVDDTQTGCIVPNGHTQTFTESVMKICENKERFIAMSNNALCKAVDTESKYVSELWENIL